MNFAALTSGISATINPRNLNNLIKGLFFLFILPATLISCSGPKIKSTDLGSWNQITVEKLLEEAATIQNPGEKIAFISEAFLETPYIANTLIGNPETSEIFVLRLDGVDCFTLLDYVEALRKSSTFADFKETLRRTRYRQGRVDFLHRNHFFSEWGNANSSQLQDVTSLVGGISVQRVEKQLNQKENGRLYLPGYPVMKRTVAFIPPEAIDASVFSQLQSGDYVGIYSPLPGLDVSHTGIVVKKGEQTFLRHASSRELIRKVVDEELAPYLGGEKGLIVFRAIDAG